MDFINSLFGTKSKTESELPPDIIEIFEKIRRLMEDEDLQNSKYPPTLREKVLSGLAVDELPNGIGEFGRYAENPIPVNGPIGELIYLSRLMTKDTKEKILFHRIGSVAKIDAYETVSIDGKKWDLLFLDFYHPRKSRKAPDGYQIVDIKKQPLIYGTNQQVSQFPYGLQKSIKDTNEQFFGISLPPPEVGIAQETIDFHRPKDHEYKLKIASQSIKLWQGIIESGVLK
jgi:hypothetical protein